MEDTHVEVKVYNSIGKVITTLVNEQLCRGHHKVIFDGKNLPKGLYIYTIRMNDKFETGNLLKE